MTWTCSTCDATIAGSRAEHCDAKGLACFALWPAVATPDLNAAAFEKAPDGRWVSTQDPSDPLSPIAKLVEPLGLIPVDPDELVGGSGPTPMLRMQSVMFLGGQHAEVARIVVGSIPIDVVNLLAVFRSGDDTMLVCLDVLAGKTPAEPDVPLTVDEPTGLSRRWFFAVPKCANWLGIGTKPFLPAGITPPPLVSSSRDDLTAVDTDNVHNLIIQWWCHETFTSTTSGDMHRTGKHGQITGPARRRCLTEAEMLDRGMTRNRSGQWATGLVDTRWNAAHCSPVATESDEQGQAGTHGPQATERPSESRIARLPREDS